MKHSNLIIPSEVSSYFQSSFNIETIEMGLHYWEKDKTTY